MLSHIRIRNFAIIDEAELELSPGMTVLTGETGAGKSILVGAMGLVLGDRADSATVRHGAERAEITASFEIDRDSPAIAWLREQALDSEDECVLRRVISREGRSKSFINGQSVPLRSLTELGEQLVDIHGQHAHQSLLRNQTQMELLDTHGGYADLCNDVTRSFVVGDRAADVGLARTLGIPGCLVLTGYGREEHPALGPDLQPGHVAEDLLAAVRWWGREIGKLT